MDTVLSCSLLGATPALTGRNEPLESRTEQKLSQGTGIFLLWVGWIIGPLAFVIHLPASYLAPQWACANGDNEGLYTLTEVMLLVAACGVLLNWYSWRKLGMEWPDSDETVVSRSRFMSMVGLLVNALSFFAILGQGIPIVILGTCS
jgi:NADH:ubiquinone oxidoreductase subunit 3 (subunit A)